MYGKRIQTKKSIESWLIPEVRELISWPVKRLSEIIITHWYNSLSLRGRFKFGETDVASMDVTTDLSIVGGISLSLPSSFAFALLHLSLLSMGNPSKFGHLNSAEVWRVMTRRKVNERRERERKKNEERTRNFGKFTLILFNTWRLLEQRSLLWILYLPSL